MSRSALPETADAPTSTKARILAAAEGIFAASGFDGASTREIAAKARVNISSLHYHWESKETLYYAVFENVYDRLLAVVRSSIPEGPIEPAAGRLVIDEAMGRLFDFFSDHPNVAKLLVRRLLETGEGASEIEREILVPAWRSFTAWTYDAGKFEFNEVDARILMLTVHSVLLLFMLDSRQFTSLLGASVRTPELSDRLRRHVIGLVHGMLQTASSGRLP